MTIKRHLGEPQAIHTATWFTPLPTGFQRVGISRGLPKGFKGEHWRVLQLAPGPWYKTVHPGDYMRRFCDLLNELAPDDITEALFHCGPNPVMVCFESVQSIAAGTKFCHRHIVAKWLSETLDIPVKEIGHPDLYPFKAFDRLGVQVPTWKEPINILQGG